MKEIQKNLHKQEKGTIFAPRNKNSIVMRTENTLTGNRKSAMAAVEAVSTAALSEKELLTVQEFKQLGHARLRQLVKGVAVC